MTADKLIRLLQRYDLASTWAVTEPHRSAAADLLACSARSYELSLLATETWAHGQVERRKFAETLEHYLQCSRDRSLPVVTVVFPPGHGIPHVDLLQKQRVQAVRADDGRRPRDQNTPAYAVRFGLWNVPVSGSFPEVSRWSWPPVGGTSRMVRDVRRGEAAHLVIRADQIAGQTYGGWRGLERVLRCVGEAQQGGHISVCTVSEFVRQLSAGTARTPARSILRKAA